MMSSPGWRPSAPGWAKFSITASPTNRVRKNPHPFRHNCSNCATCTSTWSSRCCEPRPEDLARSGLTFSELADIIATNLENAGGGIVSHNGKELTIRAVTRTNSLQDIANLPVKFAAGVKPLLVKDLAEVSYGSRPRTGAATSDGEETVLGVAMLLAGANSHDVAHRVRARLAEIQEELPDNVQLQPLYDRSILIDKSIHTVRNNLFEGAILVVAILFALLGNWRAALIVTAAIPLSFLFALMGMEKLGI